jgi:kexin
MRRPHLSLLRPLSLIVAISCAVGSVSCNYNQLRVLPAKRSYDTHHYYALEIHPSHAHITPSEAATVLGVEYIEQIGELKHHYLVRSEKSFEATSTAGLLQRRHLPVTEDPVLQRWSRLSHARRNPAVASRGEVLTPREIEAAVAIRSLERQELRMRHKRDKIISPWDTPQLFPQARDPIPGPEPHPYPEPLPRPPIIPSGLIAKMQTLHQIADPIFPEQWHLANDKRAGYDLNVSSVWASNITGKGINVCLIDDGLDLKSPDLASNFVSR